MKYLLDFRVFEAKNQEILKILKSNTGYYNLFNSFLEEGTSIEDLSNLIEKIRRDRDLIKIDLNTLKSVEEIDDYLTKVEEDSKYNKVLGQLSNKYNHLLDDKVKSLLYDNRNDIELLKIFFKKIKIYKDSISFYNALKSFITNNKGEFNLKSILPKIDNTSVIKYKSESLLIVQVKNFKQSQELGSGTNWCISRAENYFNTYAHNRSQCFIWDFTQDSHSVRSQIGVTIENSGKIYTAHFKDDSRCPDDYIMTNFVDELNLSEYLYNYVLGGNTSDIKIIGAVINSNIDKSKKDKMLNVRRVLETLISNTVYLFHLMDKGYNIDFLNFFQKVDKNYMVRNAVLIIGILTRLSENIDVSNLIPYIYFRIGNDITDRFLIEILQKDINTKIKLTQIGFNLNSYAFTSFRKDKKILSKLVDIAIDEGRLTLNDIKEIDEGIFNELKDKYETAFFEDVPFIFLPLIKIETLIEDFDYRTFSKPNDPTNKPYNFVMDKLLTDVKYQDKILEKFKTKNKSAYNKTISNLSKMDDIKVKGSDIYYDGKKSLFLITDLFNPNKFGGYFMENKYRVLDYLLKDDIEPYDNFYDDTIEFYRSVFGNKSVAEVMKSPFYIKKEIEDKEDIMEVKLGNWGDFSFNIPMSLFYDTWEKSKKEYIEYILFDFWFAFKDNFDKYLGFYKKIGRNSTEVIEPFVRKEGSYYTKELKVNPFKVWGYSYLRDFSIGKMELIEEPHLFADVIKHFFLNMRKELEEAFDYKFSDFAEHNYELLSDKINKS